jgi:hypothetical protein
VRPVEGDVVPTDPSGPGGHLGLEAPRVPPVLRYVHHQVRSADQYQLPLERAGPDSGRWRRGRSRHLCLIQTEGGIWFASEPEALFASGSKPRLGATAGVRCWAGVATGVRRPSWTVPAGWRGTFRGDSHGASAPGHAPVELGGRPRQCWRATPSAIVAAVSWSRSSRYTSRL